jgi:hypothetical protein
LGALISVCDHQIAHLGERAAFQPSASQRGGTLVILDRLAFGHHGYPNLVLLRCIQHKRTRAQGRHGDADLLLLGLGEEERGERYRYREPNG